MTFCSAATAPHWLAKTTDAGTGCYVHLPFCDRICPYCDFAVTLYRGGPIDRYIHALLLEIENEIQNEIEACSSGPSGPLGIQTLYFGGGTPSALPAQVVRRVAGTIFERFATQSGSIEFTIEANPSRNLDDLSAYLEIGVNRLSIGVQSFEDGELHRLGRTHDAPQARAYYEAARLAGFENISLDIIAGTPGQTTETFVRSLQTALELAPEHISVYALTIEHGTPYATWHTRDPSSFPDDDALAELLDRAHEALTRAGMAHYEISNFARPGYESAHNIGYWRQRDCVAFGLSAAGYRGGVRYKNTKDIAAYCAALESGRSAREEEEQLDGAARLGEAAMLALRTSAGIEYEDFVQRFRTHPRDLYAAVLEKCKVAGLLEVDDRGARLTSSGRLLANSVCAEFLEPRLAVG